MFSALLASIGYAGGVVVDKMLLSVYRMPMKKYIPLLFLCLAGLTLFLVPKWGGINEGQVSFRYVCLFILMIVVAVIWNIYYYAGLQKENLHEFELIMLLSPLVTIVFAMIFLPAERNFGIFTAGVVASAAFMFTRLRGHHIALTRAAKMTVVAMLLISFESILIRGLLNVFSPVTLYFFRTLVIALVFIYMYKPTLSNLPKPEILMTLASASFGVLQMVLKYYGFKQLGVIETTTVLLLGPFLIYAFSYWYFNDKVFARRDVACVGVVLLCIIYSVTVHK